MTLPEQPDSCTLGDLRRTMDVGFTRIDSKLDHLVEHVNRTDRDVAELRARVSAVERKIYSAAGAAALIGMGLPYVAQSLGG